MRIAVIAATISIWVLSGPAWGQAKHHTDNASKPTNAKNSTAKPQQIGTKEFPVFVHLEDTPKNQTAPAPTAKGDSESNWYDKLSAWSALWTAIFTGILMAVGGIGVCAAVRTLKAIERQGQLMELAQSASVGIVAVNFGDPKAELNVDNPQAAFERSIAQISMKNTGSSKAIGVRLTVNIIIEGIPGLVTTPEDMSETIASDIHPDVITNRTTESLMQRLPNSQGIGWQYAVEGKLRLYGTLAYKDIFGNDYETEYTARSLGRTSVFPFAVNFELISTEKRIKASHSKQKQGKAN
jgi:hypothetical protein